MLAIVLAAVSPASASNTGAAEACAQATSDGFYDASLADQCLDDYADATNP